MRPNTQTTKPKLLYIITQCHWGGAQKYVYDLAASLADNFEITIACGFNKYTNGKFRQKICDNNKIRAVHLKYLKRRINPLYDLLAILEIRKLYKKLRPNIVHLNSSKAGILGSIARSANMADSLRIIYTAHGWAFNEPAPLIKKKIYQLAEQYTAPKKDKIITVSKKDYTDATVILKLNPQKIQTIKLGIDSLALLSKTEARKKFNLEDDKYVVGTIANFYKTKGLDILIKAFKEAVKINKNIRLLIIGDGPHKKECLSMIKMYGIAEYATTPGFLKNGNKYLSAFDVFALPSKKEGMPYALLEAKAAKIPVIAANVGGVPEIIEDKKTGLLIKPNNPEELKRAILYSYNNTDRMKKMAEAGYNEFICKYAKNKMIENTNRLYLSLLC